MHRSTLVVTLLSSLYYSIYPTHLEITIESFKAFPLLFRRLTRPIALRTIRSMPFTRLPQKFDVQADRQIALLLNKCREIVNRVISKRATATRGNCGVQMRQA